MSTDSQKNDAIKTLIDKAGKLAGSEYKLAKAMGVPQSHLSMWKSGVKTCTPGDRARLAGFAREDAIQELARATIDSAKGLKREQLMRLLGKASRATGGAHVFGMLSISSLIFGLMNSDDLLRCIERRVRGRYALC